MAKSPTFPTLFDEVLQVPIIKLKELGYLKPDRVLTGTLHWSRNGKEIATISITVNMIACYVELDYNYNKEPRKYCINLVSLPSNIGKGERWYFVCPSTKKRCMKLYLVGGYFLHREAFKGCMYKKQTKGKAYREQMKMIDAVFGTGKLYKQLHQKHFKPSYAGKPTKRYLKLMQKIKRTESVSAIEVERLLLPKGRYL
jgi:hypothetical protein